jgi:hypothetical protein
MHFKEWSGINTVRTTMVINIQICTSVVQCEFCKLWVNTNRLDRTGRYRKPVTCPKENMFRLTDYICFIR